MAASVPGSSSIPLLGETIGSNLAGPPSVSGTATTVTGKVQKFRMREIAVLELGLEAVAAAKTA
jgi:hypothetical protein